MLQLGIHSSTPAFVSSLSATSITTASFSPPARSTIVVMAAFDGTAGNHTINTPTSSGLVFTAAPGMVNTRNGPVGIWVCANVPDGSRTVNITTSAPAAEFSMYVPVVLGAETTFGGASGSGSSSSGLPSANLTATRNGSLLFAVSSDWTAKGLGTVGPAQTMMQEQHNAGGLTAHYWRKNLWVRGGTHTLNLTAPAAEDYNLAVVEIRPLAVIRAARARRQR